MLVVELSTDRIPSPPQKGGAIERYVFQISKALASLGVNVHLISVGDGFYSESLDGVVRHVYDREGFNFLEAFVGSIISKLSSELNRKILYVTRIVYSYLSFIEETYGGIDVIHNHYFTTAIAPPMFRALKNRGITLATHYHNVPKESAVNKLLARLYDLHLAVSRYVAEEIVKRLGVRRDRVYVVYNAIDVEGFECLPESSNSEKERLGLEGDTFIVLYVGRITPEKGLHHLVMAFRRVIRAIPKSALLIAGPVGHFDTSTPRDEAYFRYITRLIRELGIERNVKWLGYVADARKIYRVADVVAVPSLWQDACPTVVMEALASCKPVVAYPTGGIPEILEGLPYSFLAERIDPEALAKKIVEVASLRHKIDYKLLRRHIEERFSVNVVAGKLKELFEGFAR